VSVGSPLLETSSRRVDDENRMLKDQLVLREAEIKVLHEKINQLESGERWSARRYDS
jgi:hypothetical protein